MHHMEVGKFMKNDTTGIFGTGEVYISSPQHWDPHPAGGLQRANPTIDSIGAKGS